MASALEQLLGLEGPDPRDVAYWDGYLPKLRQAVFQEGLDCDRSDPRAVSRIELLQALYFVFFGERPEVRAPAPQRYRDALLFLVKYLDESKFPSPITHELLLLSQALDGLGRGITHPLFEIKREPGGRPIDPVDIWELRASVASALDYLIESQKMPAKQACDYIEKRYGILSAVLSPTSKDFSKTILSWRRKFTESNVPHESAQRQFDRRMERFDQLRRVGFGDLSIADKILADSMLVVTRTSDAAMDLLYPEVERRVRQNTPY